jgi:hypothetical protein
MISIRIVPPDLSGKLKMRTREFFVFNVGWHAPKELCDHPILGNPLYDSGWRCLSVRLSRYYRSGLLWRRRRDRHYEYHITERGVERLIHCWKRFGSFDIRDSVDERLVCERRKLAGMKLRISMAFDEYQLEKANKKMEELDSSHSHSSSPWLTVYSLMDHSTSSK